MTATASISIEVVVGDQVYTGKVGRIESTHLGHEDHGGFTFNINLAFGEGGSKQGTGHMAVGPYIGAKETVPGGPGAGSGYSMDVICQLIDIVGVENWESMRGKRVVALYVDDGPRKGLIVGLASLVNDKVIIFKDHAEEWRRRAGIL